MFTRDHQAEQGSTWADTSAGEGLAQLNMYLHQTMPDVAPQPLVLDPQDQSEIRYSISQSQETACMRRAA